MSKLLTHFVEFRDNRLAKGVFGEMDGHLKLIEERLGITCHPRGNTVVMTGNRGALKKGRHLLEELYTSMERGELVDRQRVEDGIRILETDTPLGDIFSERCTLRTALRTVYPRSATQASYVEMLLDSDLTFAIGPAGTGKTYLAVAVAVASLLEGKLERIILTRPVVEAGERLGFLPGDLQAKVDPYLRPLYDALNEMVGVERLDRMMQQGILEVAPLAYMRGRTLKEAFIILDEAQNTTPEQMKMFLTRFGEGAKAVVAGDITQVDLPRGQLSGLAQALTILRDVEGIGITAFSERDVVRHPLVRKIVQAYERAEKSPQGG